MSIEFEATNGSRATQTLFEASEIKVVKLVLGTTSVLLATPEHEEGSRTLNICMWHNCEQQGSAHQQQRTGVAAEVSAPSDGSHEEPVDMEEMTERGVCGETTWLHDDYGAWSGKFNSTNISGAGVLCPQLSCVLVLPRACDADALPAIFLCGKAPR